MFLYRYVDMKYTDYIRIHEEKYKIIKETPCGYWIRDSFFLNDSKKWVSKTARKRFAYPTKKEAMINFKARKNRQIKILNARIERAKIALDRAIKIEKEIMEDAIL